MMKEVESVDAFFQRRANKIVCAFVHSFVFIEKLPRKKFWEKLRADDSVFELHQDKNCFIENYAVFCKLICNYQLTGAALQAVKRASLLSLGLRRRWQAKGRTGGA